MFKVKIQYLGSIPLIADEILTEKLLSLNLEKHETFTLLQDTKNLRNDLILKTAQDNAYESNQPNKVSVYLVFHLNNLNKVNNVFRFLWKIIYIKVHR